jgi:bifunctional UDP-N-acetylglucosamine pyrophosphorylase/glucosamine-1-phosphate N-acetyltransferase
MNPICTIILAAGKGTRLKSEKPKVMHEILGLPLIHYPLSLAQRFSSDVICVVGHGRDTVGPYLKQYHVSQVVQDPPLGTGHAVMMARDILRDTAVKDVVIIPGDMPLIQQSSLTSLIDVYHRSGAPIGILTAKLPEPFGYGRIIRDREGFVKAIVEHNDATEEQRRVNEINTGVYIISKNFLLDAVDRLTPNNVKGEYYLTDIVHMADHAAAFTAQDFNEAHGINSRAQLSHAASIMQLRINNGFMEEGVTLIDPSCAWISPLADIGQDVEIWPNVHIMGKCRIGSSVTIMPNTWIMNSSIGDGTTIGSSCVIENAGIPPAEQIPPFSRIEV